MNTQDHITALTEWQDRDLIKRTLQVLKNPRIKNSERNSIEFSPRLNKFLIDWYSNHTDKFIFTEVDDFDGEDIEGTFQKHRTRYLKTGKIHIWTGASDTLIFVKPTVNHYFRAWHDFIHITENLGYDFIGESSVCKIQQAKLPMDWAFERALIDSEIVGQALYFMKYGEFIEDQRAFTLEFLETGRINKKF